MVVKASIMARLLYLLRNLNFIGLKKGITRLEEGKEMERVEVKILGLVTKKRCT